MISVLESRQKLTLSNLQGRASLLSATVALLAGSLWNSDAFAQTTEPPAVTEAALPQSIAEGGETPADAVADSTDGGEIVVTALKRSTQLQDTPLAISAVTGDSLERGGNYSFTNLTNNTPSLRIVDSGPGNRRVILRGVTAAGEPTVGVYYDESPVSGSVGTTSDSASSTPDLRLFDVARAEILRGPQGTLYGSGSMGGTVRVIFEKPKADRVEGAVNANLTTAEGGDMGYSLDGMINLPIVDDKIALRVVGNYNKFAGYVDNIRLNLKDVNDGDSYGGRALLRLTPTDRLTVDAAVYYEKVATDSSRWISETGQRHVTNGRAESGNYDENRIYSGTVRYDFDAVSLTAVTTYFDRDRTAVGDVSDTFIGRDNAAGCARFRNRNATCSPEVLASYLADTRRLFASSLFQPQSVQNWTNEIRLSSMGDGPFNWTAGVYSENRDTVVRSTLLVADPATGELLDVGDPANLAYDRTIFDYLKQKAAFVEASYEVLDGLTFTAGTRYYEYKKRVGGQIDLGQEHYSSVVTPYQESRSKEDGFIYKFNLSWEANSDLLFYAQAAQGFRPGGVNQVIGLPAALAAYTSDSLWNYEAGVKSTLARGVYLNVAAYRIDWDNLQVSGRTAGTGSVFGLIANAGAAKIEGVEVEFSARPIDGLSIGTNIGYTDARLSEDQVSTIVTSTGREGDRLAFVPKWSLSATAEYTWPVNDTVEGLARFDVAHTGASFSTLSSTDVFRRKVDSYELANLRAGVQSPDGDWGAYLFVNNLFDAAAVNSRSSSSNTGGLTLTYSAPPRTYGLNVTKRF